MRAQNAGRQHSIDLRFTAIANAPVIFKNPAARLSYPLS